MSRSSDEIRPDSIAEGGQTQVRCPECYAENIAGKVRCWLCGASLNKAAFAVPQVAREPASIRRSAATFTISSLMLLIAIVAIFLGVLREAPGLAILLAILATPALIRTSVMTTRRRAKGQPMTSGERLLAFAGSFGVVAATGAASAAAFAAICFGSVMVGAASKSQDYAGLAYGLYFGLPVGVLVAVYVFYRFVRWLWPIKDNR